jgi:hypothetical protein
MSKEDDISFEEWAMSETKIPKFRKTKRLVEWIQKMGHFERLPSSHEEIFFTSKEDPSIIASNLFLYVNRIKVRLEPRFEEVIKKDKNSLFSYIQSVKAFSGETLTHLVEELKGDSNNLYRWACQAGRLPEHLEKSISCPRIAYLYAKNVLYGRLPEDMEDVFMTDVHHACKYAFEVIRGFAPVKLPEKLHSYVLLKSFENPNNEIIKNYISASENDPNKTGNVVQNGRY